MKIYTKTGDEGQTSIIGKRLCKSCLEIEAIGEVDELNGYVGLILSKMKQGEFGESVQILKQIQSDLFVVGSNIAAIQMELGTVPVLSEERVQILEKKIDEMELTLPELKNFILPGGSEIAALCFVARAICRRSERVEVGLKKKYPNLDVLVQKYLNRLSDYLFVLARFVNKNEGIEEVIWKK